MISVVWNMPYFVLDYGAFPIFFKIIVTAIISVYPAQIAEVEFTDSKKLSLECEMVVLKKLIKLSS